MYLSAANKKSRGDLGILVQHRQTPATGLVGSIPYVAGTAALLVGQGALPKDANWSKVVRTGMLLGGLVTGGLALYQILKPGIKPEADLGFDAKDFFITSEPGWRALGTPRIDLTIQNKKKEPVDLIVKAGQYLDKVSDLTREVTLAPVSMEIPAGGKKTHEFFLTLPPFWTSARILSFQIIDPRNNQVIAEYDARYPQRFEG